MLMEQTWNLVCRLEFGAFETIGGEVVKVVLAIIANVQPPQNHELYTLDVSSAIGSKNKSKALIEQKSQSFLQEDQIANPLSRIAFNPSSTKIL